MFCYRKQQLMAHTHSHCLQFMNGIFTLKKIMAPFYGWGLTASRLEPLQGGKLLFFTTKFPEIPGTHFINLRWMKAESTGPNTGQK